MCDDIDYKIGVMQAFKEGKIIESQYKGNDSWYLASDPYWDWFAYNYRVKEEPKEDWVVEHINIVSGKWKHYQVLHEITESHVKAYIEAAKGVFTVPPTFRYRRIEPAKE